MRRVRVRLPVFRAVLALLSAVFTATALAQSGELPAMRDFHVEAQDAASGLADFGEQSGQQLLFDYDAVQGLRTRAIVGPHSIARALEGMLEGTGLTFDVINPRTISVRRAISRAPDHPAAMLRCQHRVRVLGPTVRH